MYLLIPGNEVGDIVNVTAMAVRDAQEQTDSQGVAGTKKAQEASVVR